MTEGFSLTETAVDHRETLSLLGSDGPLSSRGLEAELDCSLATVNRHLGTLREHDLVKKSEHVYELTVLGEAALRTIDETARQLSVFEAVADSRFISNVADAPMPFDVFWLADSTVIRSTATDPYGLYHRYVEVFNASSRLRALRNEGITPPGVVDAMTPKLLDPAFDAAGIWSRAQAERFIEAHPVVNEIRRKNPTLGVFVSNESVPVDFSLFDSCLVILSYDQRTGHPAVYIETENDHAMQWAENVFAHYRERSKTIPEVFDDYEY